MGGGIFGAKGNANANEELLDQSKDFLNLIKPLQAQSQTGVANILAGGPEQFNTLNAANNEALQTGAANAYVPSIQKATESSLRAGSQARQRTSEDLTRQGVTGTDYDSLIANLTQQNYFNASQAGAPYYEQQANAASQYAYGQAGQNTNFYRDILSSFYKSLTGIPQLGLQGFQTSATNEQQSNIANTKAATDLIVGLANSTKSGGNSGLGVLT